MDLANHIALGISLAACSGLRACMPLFALGLLSRFCGITINPSLHWLASDPALIVLGIATLLEFLGDKIPAVDHFLDMIGTVLRPGSAVIILTALSSTQHLTTALIIGLLVGVPTSLGIHAGKAGVRISSTTLTLGTMNFVISFVEDLICAGLALLAAILPIYAAFVTIALLAFSVYLITHISKKHILKKSGP